MANSFQISKNSGIISKSAAGVLADTVQFFKSVDKADASDYDGKNGYSAGDTISIAIPARFDPQSTFDITSTIQDITEPRTTLVLDIISTVGVDVDSQQLASEIQLKSLLNRVIIPAATDMAADVENKMLEKATDLTYNSVGVPGSTVFDVQTVQDAKVRMNKFLCPKDANRFLLLNSDAGASAVNARKGLFQSAAKISEQYEMGYVGTADGFHWMENELLNSHTNGNDVTGVALNTVTVTNGMSSFAVSGLTNTTGTITKGQVFTLSGIKAVHPQTGVAYNFDQQFVVTADATANGSGVATISFSPAIYLTTSQKNVASTPTTTNALVFVGSASTAYVQNLAFHKNAFRSVSVPLVMPTAVEVASQETVENVTVQFVRQFDVLKRRMINRLDFLGGISAVRPEWACRIYS